MAFFQQLGWHDEQAEFAGSVVNWLSAITGDALFPWVSSGVLGAALGIWLHYLASKYDARRSRDNWQEALGEECLNVANYLETSFGGLAIKSGTPHAVAKYEVLKARVLNEAGLSLPALSEARGVSEVVSHLQYLAGFLIANQLKQLKDKLAQEQKPDVAKALGHSRQ